MTAEEAFREHHEAVYRFLYRMTRSPETAADLTQECFMVLLQQPDRFDPARGAMKTYLFAIARNLALHHLRRERPSEELFDDDERWAQDSGRHLASSIAVADAIATLSPLQREALILFQYEGMTLDEIARLTGVDVGAVKSRLYRARETLKTILSPVRGGAQ